MDSEVVNGLIMRRIESPALCELDQGEVRLLGWIAEGRPDEEIAEGLSVGATEAALAVEALCAKLGLSCGAGDRDRVGNVLRYLATGSPVPVVGPVP
jgi:hypothetical protein